MKGKFLGIVDADSILYRVAATSEDDTLDEAINSLNGFIYNSILKPTKCKKYFFALSGGHSGRDEVAVTKPYKGQRTTEKPTHLADLKQYMIDNLNGVVFEDYEADDLVVALTHRYNPDCILLGIDKDAKQQIGYHYNYVKDEHFLVKAKDAQTHFFKQMLMGDTVDNITGLPQVGEKGVEKLFTGNPDTPPAYLTWKMYQDKGFGFEYYKEQWYLLHMKRDIIMDYESYFLDLEAYFADNYNPSEEFDFE